MRGGSRAVRRRAKPRARDVHSRGGRAKRHGRGCAAAGLPDRTGGPLRPGDLRRRRRPDPAPGGSGSVQSLQHRCATRTFRACRRRPSRGNRRVGAITCTPRCRASLGRQEPSSASMPLMRRPGRVLSGRAMSYVQGRPHPSPSLYAKIGEALAKAETAHGTKGNVIFYLAVADRFFGTVVDELAAAKLTDQQPDADGKPAFWRRVVIEKPFGHDLASAKALNARILRTLERGSDLPDRSLPGQGHRPEHHGAALRQRPVRTDLEPRTHRPCADHRRRDCGGRGTREVL